MARSKKTPGDELAEVQAKIDALVKEGEDLSARRGDAEALLRSYPDRREHALRLRKLGEHKSSCPTRPSRRACSGSSRTRNPRRTPSFGHGASAKACA